MMLAFDLVKRVSHRLQEVLVGILNFAIHGELNDRLRLIERRQHTRVHSLNGDVAPFQNVADMVALCVERAIDQ